MDDRTIDLTKWINENAGNHVGYEQTRRAEDAPFVFGIEAMLYKGMKYDFSAGSAGKEFDGNLDFSLLLEDAQGHRIEIDKFRLTSLRLPAFPGAQGFGKWSQGGRGGEVYKVTNLSGTSNSPGTLKDAMQNRKLIKDENGNNTTRLLPRTIVFAKSGEINLSNNGSVTAEGGSLTIAGQSAPGQGITVKNGSLKFGRSYTKNTAGDQVLPDPDVFRRASDYVVRYLRVRRTPAGGSSTPPNPDAVSVNSATRFIIDHCSIAWGADGGLDVNVLERPKNAAGEVIAGSPLPKEQPEMDITAQWCLVNQTLLDHSKGVLWRGKHGGRYSLIGCFMSSNDERNPVFAHLQHAVEAQDVQGCLFHLQLG